MSDIGEYKNSYARKKITHRFVKGLQPPEKPIEFYDENKNGKGLILRLSKTGSKTFGYRYRFAGKNRRFKIGKFPACSLSNARAKVRELKVKIDKGIDPQAEKRKRKYKPKELTFKELADIYSKQHLSTLTEKTRIDYRRHIDKEMLKKHNWGEIPVSEFTSQHVREILNDKAFKEGYFTAANRLRTTISSIFSFGLTNVGIKLDKNPVENTPVFEKGENERDRVYSEDEIRELWEYWEREKEEPIQSYYKMVLLLGQRRTVTMQMKWEDIERNRLCKRIEIGSDGRPIQKSFRAKIWGTVKKGGKYHELPLPDKVIGILDKLKPITGDSEYVFQSPRSKNKPLSSVKSTTEDIKKVSSVSDFRLHDLRRTLATYLEECLIDQIVIQKVLNHTVQGVTGKHYQWYNYTDKKLEALNRWSLRVETIISSEESKAKIHKLG